jgi:hypothetical protein
MANKKKYDFPITWEFLRMSNRTSGLFLRTKPRIVFPGDGTVTVYWYEPTKRKDRITMSRECSLKVRIP